MISFFLLIIYELYFFVKDKKVGEVCCDEEVLGQIVVVTESRVPYLCCRMIVEPNIATLCSWRSVARANNNLILVDALISL